MTTYLGKSCSFGLPRVPLVNCRQFMYLVISLLVLRAGCGIWLYQFLIIAYLFTVNYTVISFSWHWGDDNEGQTEEPVSLSKRHKGIWLQDTLECSTAHVPVLSIRLCVIDNELVAQQSTRPSFDLSYNVRPQFRVHLQRSISTGLKL